MRTLSREWRKRLARLERKVQTLGEVDARVAELEGLVRSQGQTSASFTDESVDPTIAIEEPKGDATPIETGQKHRKAGPTISTPASKIKLRRPKGIASPINRGIRAAAVEQVAFSAVLSHNTAHLGEHQIVAFNKVLINDGNGYNSYTGSFTCPLAGVYIFLYNVGHDGVGQTWLQLMVNGQRQNIATADAFQSNQELQGSNSAIVRLAPGDTVWVEAFDSRHDNVVDGRFMLSTFSGALLYQ